MLKTSCRRSRKRETAPDVVLRRQRLKNGDGEGQKVLDLARHLGHEDFAQVGTLLWAGSAGLVYDCGGK